jgi:hypothetical protein
MQAPEGAEQNKASACCKSTQSIKTPCHGTQHTDEDFQSLGFLKPYFLAVQ